MAIFEKLVSRAKVLERAAETGLRAGENTGQSRVSFSRLSVPSGRKWT